MVEANLRVRGTKKIALSGISGADNFLIPLKGMPFYRSLGSSGTMGSGNNGVGVNKCVCFRFNHSDPIAPENSNLPSGVSGERYRGRLRFQSVAR